MCIFSYSTEDKRLMVSNYRRPWTTITSEQSQVRFQPLNSKGKEKVNEKEWAQESDWTADSIAYQTKSNNRNLLFFTLRTYERRSTTTTKFSVNTGCPTK